MRRYENSKSKSFHRNFCHIIREGPWEMVYRLAKWSGGQGEQADNVFKILITSFRQKLKIKLHKTVDFVYFYANKVETTFCKDTEWT